MTKKYIKDISELPNWFELSKYKDLKNLSKIEWYEQIKHRTAYPPFLDEESNQRTEDYAINILNNNLKNLRTNPIQDLIKDQEIVIVCGGKFLVLKKMKKGGYGFPHPPIRPFFVNDLCNNILQFLPETWDSIVNQISNLSKANLKNTIDILYNPLIDSLDNSYKKNPQYYSDIIVLDLSLSDKILKDSFSDYLKKKRKSIPIDQKEFKPIKEQKFNDWIAFGILPYMDLKIWSEEKNVLITNKIMSEAILKNFNQDGETIRKVTAPLVKKIISNKNMRSFMSIISKDKII